MCPPADGSSNAPASTARPRSDIHKVYCSILHVPPYTCQCPAQKLLSERPTHVAASPRDAIPVSERANHVAASLRDAKPASHSLVHVVAPRPNAKPASERSFTDLRRCETRKRSRVIWPTSPPKHIASPLLPPRETVVRGLLSGQFQPDNTPSALSASRRNSLNGNGFTMLGQTPCLRDIERKLAR